MIYQKKVANIAYCFLIAICYVVLIKVIGSALYSFKFSTDILSFAADISSALVVLIIMLCLHRQNILRGNIKGLAKGFSAGGFLCGYIIIMLLSFFMMDFSVKNLQPPIHILLFTLSMVLTGFSEEILFRGIIFNILGDCFGKKSRFAIYGTTALSSFIFGFMHLSNVFSGVSFGGALIQTISAFAVGCYFNAIYIRCGNIWSIVILHSLTNFVSLLNVGFLGNGDIASSISEYTPIRLASVFLYLGLTVFLLRASKMKYLE